MKKKPINKKPRSYEKKNILSYKWQILGPYIQKFQGYITLSNKISLAKMIFYVF